MVTIAGAGMFLTPDSPADAQHAGVVDATAVVINGERSGIAATGWALHQGSVKAVFWETSNGETWRGTPLPNQGFEGEVGIDVAVSAAGEIVLLGGPIHIGVGAVVRGRSWDEWDAVPSVDDGFVAAVAGNEHYLSALEGSGQDGRLRRILWREVGEADWAAERLPSGLTDGGPNLVLEASGWHDPVLIERSGHQGVCMWTFDRQGWSATQLRGDYLISAATDHIATRAGDRVLIYDRRVD